MTEETVEPTTHGLTKEELYKNFKDYIVSYSVKKGTNAVKVNLADVMFEWTKELECDHDDCPDCDSCDERRRSEPYWA